MSSMHHGDKLTLALCQIFGILGGGLVKPSWPLVLYSIVMQVFIIILHISHQIQTDISGLSGKLSIFRSVLLCFSIPVIIFKNIDTHSSSANILPKIDDSPGREKFKTCFLALLCSLLFAFETYLKSITSLNLLLYTFSLYFLSFQRILSGRLYCAAMKRFKSEFSILSSNIGLPGIVKAQEKCYVDCKTVFLNHSMPILIIISGLVCNLTFGLYFLLKAYFDLKIYSRLNVEASELTTAVIFEMIINSILLLLQCIEIYFILSQTVDTKREGDDFTYKYLYQHFIDNEKRFSTNWEITKRKLIANEQLSFAPYNLFEIDFGLLADIFSGAMTYLLILVQFGMYETTSGITAFGSDTKKFGEKILLSYAPRGIVNEDS